MGEPSSQNRSKQKSNEIVEDAVNKISKLTLFSKRRVCPPESWAMKKFISLDGENHTYTTVLLICMNLAILVWIFERGLMQNKDGGDWFIDWIEGGVALRRLFKSAILLLCAIINGVLAFTLLALNLRDLDSMELTIARRWLFLSSAGLVAANALTVSIIISAQNAYKWRLEEDKSYEKPFPHYMILTAFGFFVYLLDVLYIRTIYLPFVTHKVEGWELVRRNLKKIIKMGHRERGETSIIQEIGYFIMSGINTIAWICNYLIFRYFNTNEKLLKWAQRVLTSNNCIYSSFKVVTVWISEASLAPIRLIRATEIHILFLEINRLLKTGIKKTFRWLLAPIIEFSKQSRLRGQDVDASWHHRTFRGVLRAHDQLLDFLTNFKPEVQETANELWNGIKEEPDYRHSSWLKASVATAFVMLVYFGFKGAYEFEGYITDVYKPTRACMINNSGVSNFFLRYIGFAESKNTTASSDQFCAVPTSALESPQIQSELQNNITSQLLPFVPSEATSDVQMISAFGQILNERVEQNLEEDRLYKCDERRREEDVCAMLAVVNLAEERLHPENDENARKPYEVFLDSFTGQLAYIFDVYVRNLEWTIWIGFMVGMLFGVWTLLSVMGQYKKLCLVIRCGYFSDFHVGEKSALARTATQKMGVLRRVDSINITNSFADTIASYPMSTSIFFSGMLISTAVLQLVVFGAIVASMISLLASLVDDKVLEILKPTLWAILAFFVTWLVNGPIATFVIGEGLLVTRFHVVHELLFFLFLLVFTSVHIVIGIFLAFFRMLWVLLTSLITINRLDKNLFSLCKERDLGHRSFMALIFMQHVFHLNRSGNAEQIKSWEEIIQKLEDNERRDAIRRTVNLNCPVATIGSEPKEVLINQIRAMDPEEFSEFQDTAHRLRHAKTDLHLNL